MKKKKNKPRKQIRLPEDAYLGGEPFILTVCTHHRLPIFRKPGYAKAATDMLAQAALKTGAQLWCGVIMPDHAHMLVNADEGKSPLDVGACFKRLTTLRLRSLGFADTLWQRRVHDRGIRREFSNAVAAVHYVLDNPVRQGLVSRWDEWPYTYVDSRLVESL